MNFLSIRGFRMAVRQAGSGQPLLLVHGYPLNGRMWTPQFNYFSRQMQVFVPDLRGHGQSEAVAGPYYMEMLADDLAALLTTLTVHTPVVLCGLSMGGYVALAFARRYPQKLAALVLADTRAAPDTPQARQNREAAMQQVQSEGIEIIARGMLPRLLAPTTLNEKPDLLVELNEIMLETSVNGVSGALAGMKDRPDARPFLPQIAVPTLVIHGEADGIVPLEEARQVAEAIPKAQLAVIPQSGHMPNLEKPELFNFELDKFIKESVTGNEKR